MCKYELPMRQDFRKLLSDRQADRQTRPKLYTTPRRFASGQEAFRCLPIEASESFSTVQYSSVQYRCILSDTTFKQHTHITCFNNRHC